jgi:hypothetical protein
VSGHLGKVILYICGSLILLVKQKQDFAMTVPNIPGNFKATVSETWTDFQATSTSHSLREIGNCLNQLKVGGVVARRILRSPGAKLKQTAVRHAKTSWVGKMVFYERNFSTNLPKRQILFERTFFKTWKNSQAASRVYLLVY